MSREKVNEPNCKMKSKKGIVIASIVVLFCLVCLASTGVIVWRYYDTKNADIVVEDSKRPVKVDNSGVSDGSSIEFKNVDISNVKPVRMIMSSCPTFKDVESLANNWKAKLVPYQTTGGLDRLSGTLAPHTAATVTISEVKHGNAFDGVKTALFTLSWFVALE